MKSILLVLAVLTTCAAILFACSRDDGFPDPPVQVLVPCNPDASADDPLACPPLSTDDGGLGGDSGSD
jgi:hypothetical protein